MTFNALQKLEKEKRGTIINELIRGTSAKAIARTIKEQWGDARDFSLTMLERELNKLRKAINCAALPGRLANPAQGSLRPDGIRVNSLKELEQLAELVRNRIEWLRRMEARQAKYMPELSKALKTYEKLLVTIQKIRFDLALDEYKRVTLTRREREAAIAQAKEESKRENDRQVFKATRMLEEALEANRSKLRARGLEEARRGFAQ